MCSLHNQKGISFDEWADLGTLWPLRCTYGGIKANPKQTEIPCFAPLKLWLTGDLYISISEKVLTQVSLSNKKIYDCSLQSWSSCFHIGKHESFYSFKERFPNCSQMMRWRASLAVWGQRSAAQDWWIREKTVGNSSSIAFADSSRWTSPIFREVQDKHLCVLCSFEFHY